MTREEELRIHALGAAISRRDWHATEVAHAAIRDAAHRTPALPDNEGALREALKPFAKVGGYMERSPGTRRVDLIYNAVEADGLNSHGKAALVIEDFLRARLALEARP